MLIVKEGGKSREKSDAKYFVELINYRSLDFSGCDCDRLGYWCDKLHLRHFILELAKVFTEQELKELLKL